MLPYSSVIKHAALWLVGPDMPGLLNLGARFVANQGGNIDKNIADKFGADESYLTVTLKNIFFFRRNVEYFYPIAGVERWEGKYLPIGMNLFPIMGLSYTIKF